MDTIKIKTITGPSFQSISLSVSILRKTTNIDNKNEQKTI